MPRIHRPTAQRREEILDAAHTLFTTKGFQPTTMEDILRIVGIAKGTLYYHFPSKEQILRALVLHGGGLEALGGEQGVRGVENLLATLSSRTVGAWHGSSLM